MSKPERKFKDTVFTALFSEKEKILELYNALDGKTYGHDIEIKIRTLENVFYNSFKNDLAFEIDNKFIVLIEHQSSINENMPLRMLRYFSNVIERIIDIEKIYREKRIQIPVPEFFVLYNGIEKYDNKILRLSDAYITDNTDINLDLIVKIININYLPDSKVLEESKTLRDYSIFIARIRKHQNEGKALKEAIESSIKECIKESVLKDFLEKYGREVLNMLFVDYDYETHMRVLKEEAFEKGEAAGIEIGEKSGKEIGEKVGKEMERKKIAANLLQRNIPANEIAEITGLSVSQIIELTH